MKLTSQQSKVRAFGFINMIVTVAVIAIIGSISYVAMTNVSDRAEERLLNDQVASLNKSVKLYLNNGGSIDGLTTAQQVIDKMKTLAANGEKMAGFRGNFIDPRLQAVEQSDEEADTTGELRVIWDAVAQNFKIAIGGPKGIKAFKIDPTATPPTIQTETRDTMFELAATSETGSWVWDFDTETTASASPLVSTTTHDTQLDIDPTGGNNNKTQLAQPVINPAPTGTALPLADFGTEGKPVAVENLNSAEDSDLLVSVNGSYWTPVDSGETVNVPPGGTVAAFANVKEGKEHLFYASYVRAGRFEATTTTLPAPTISTSADTLHPIDTETITVSLSNPNDPERGYVEVKIGDGGWQPYTTPFAIDIDAYSAGTTIFAKSTPVQWSDYYQESATVNKPIGADIVTLETPEIVMSHTTFNPVTRQDVDFTLVDNNAGGGYSKLAYSLDDGATWEDYTGPVTMSIFDHLGGVTVLAKSQPTIHIANFNESAEDSQAVAIEGATLGTPVIASQYPVLNPQGYPSSTITLSDANPGGISAVEYSTDSGATWQAYADPFQVTYAEFPEGATILAKAVPVIIPEHITESGVASTNLPIPPKLEVPGFDLAPGDYVKSIYNGGITLDDDNPAGSATLAYRVDGGSWQDYDSATGIVLDGWPNSTVPAGTPTSAKVVEVIARATDYLNNRDSDGATGSYRRIWLVPNLAFGVESSGVPSSLHEFTGSSSGLFKDAVAESSSSYTFADGSSFTWGTASGTNGASSWMTYDGTSWEGMQAGEMFRLGTLDYFNGTIASGSGATEVTLELTVELQLPDATEIFNIDLSLDNTPNIQGDADASADYVTIGNLINDFTTEIDGIEYQLNLAFGYYGNNGFSTVDQFHVHEGAVATADLWGFFTSDEF